MGWTNLVGDGLRDGGKAKRAPDGLDVGGGGERGVRAEGPGWAWPDQGDRATLGDGQAGQMCKCRGETPPSVVGTPGLKHL